ncbi:MAG: glycosyltransferase 87 family protein [Anaerolineae bacterium]|nr:glycosyltransferase 87 family protein [Anaerolineae bacterium]
MLNIVRSTCFSQIAKILLVIILLGVFLAYTLPWVDENSGSREYSGIDFHGYWYAGHYTRVGVNPYWAILNKEEFPVYWDPRYPGSGSASQLSNENPGFESELELPLSYLDGPVVEDHPVAQLLIVAPSATSPLTLFMGLFSWVSWPVARTIWLGLNLMLALLIPWLGFRLIRDHLRVDGVTKIIFALAFYNFYGLRQSLVVGQQSIICLFLLLLALLVRDRWLLAGFLLGVGLSKYSVGLPVFLLFLMQKRTRILLVSLVVQSLGVLWLTHLEHGSLLETTKAYLKALDLNYLQDGVHLLARFPENQSIGYIFSVLVIVVLVYLVSHSLLQRADPRGRSDVIQLNVLTLLTIGIFLAVYHRIHDLPFMVFFLLTIITAHGGNRNNSPREQVVITIVQFLSIFMLIFPTVPGNFLSYLGVPTGIVSTIASENATSTGAMLLTFFLTAWIQLKILAEPKRAGILKNELT